MKRYPIILALSLLFLMACSEQPSGPVDGEDAPGKAAPMDQSDTDVDLRDRYIVVFNKSVGNVDELVHQMTRGNGSTVHYRYRHAIKGFCATIPPQALEGLSRNPNVDYIEADAPVFANPSQSLPTSGSLWGLDRIDQVNLPLDNTYIYPNTASEVTAYIIDTGIRYDHSEFGGRAVFGYDAFNKDGSDQNGHGTHVAGTVGGENVGVAKAVSLVSVRVLDRRGSGTISGVIAGVDWVKSNHVDPAVANMSLGGGASTSLDQAVDNAVGAGVTFVVAAGNDNNNACYYSPARVSSAITVASTTSSDARSSFSNYGSCVDLFAPGSSIYSAYKNSSTSYATLSGTSMAAPHVAGVVALYLETNTSATPTQVASAITGNAMSGKVSGAGTGSPNLLVYTGFLGGGTPSAPGTPSGLTANAVSSSQIDVSWNTVSGATEYEVRMLDNNNTVLSTVSKTTTSHSWTGLTASTTYRFEVQAGNSVGWSGWSSPVSATTTGSGSTGVTYISAATASSTNNGNKWTAEIAVTVMDGSSTATAGTVSFSYDGDVSGSGTATISSGVATFTVSNIPKSKSLVNFYVTDVVGTSTTYTAGSNTVTFPVTAYKP